jgi:hypothetical protein
MHRVATANAVRIVRAAIRSDEPLLAACEPASGERRVYYLHFVRSHARKGDDDEQAIISLQNVDWRFPANGGRAKRVPMKPFRAREHSQRIKPHDVLTCARHLAWTFIRLCWAKSIIWRQGEYRIAT